MDDRSDSRHPLLRVPDVLAIVTIAVIVTLVTVTAISESYRNLWLFAIAFGLSGFWAAIAPAIVDSFIVVGELVLFVSLVRGWDRRVRAYGWVLTGAGFTVSLAGNIGHARSAPWQARIMFALFPVAATAGLAAGLMILKRVTAAYRMRLSGQQQVAGRAAPPDRIREPRRDRPAQREARDPVARPSASRVGRGRPPREIQITPELQADLDAGTPARALHRKYPDLLRSNWAANNLVKRHQQPALAGSNGHGSADGAAGQEAGDGG